MILVIFQISKKVRENSVLGHNHLADEKKLKLVVEDFDENLSIYADRVRIAEVLDNFVSNAIKYTNEGIVKISAEKLDPDMVKFSVADTGIGIPKKALKRLGEKFYRVGHYTNGDNGSVNVVRPGGTGLGLYVAFALVELMGGRVNVTSKMNVGSTFTFTVPLHTGQEDIVQEKQSHNVFDRMEFGK